MRSPWVASILSPVLVGLVLYSIGSLFGVDREYRNYVRNEAEKRLLSIGPLTTNSGLAGKKYVDRLVRNPEVGRLSK